MRTVKVTHVGNSAGIVLPGEILRALCVSPGDYLYLVDSPDGVRLTPFDPALDRHLSAARFYMHIDRVMLRAAHRLDVLGEKEDV